MRKPLTYFPFLLFLLVHFKTTASDSLTSKNEILSLGSGRIKNSGEDFKLFFPPLKEIRQFKDDRNAKPIVNHERVVRRNPARMRKRVVSQRNKRKSEIGNIQELYSLDNIHFLQNSQINPKLIQFQNIAGARRTKRSTNEQLESKIIINSKRFNVDYDGWFPIVSNPLSNEPTTVYKPPSLRSVHFGPGAPAVTPYYPIRPKNPPRLLINIRPVSSINPNYRNIKHDERQTPSDDKLGKQISDTVANKQSISLEPEVQKQTGFEDRSSNVDVEYIYDDDHTYIDDYSTYNDKPAKDQSSAASDPFASIIPKKIEKKLYKKNYKTRYDVPGLINPKLTTTTTPKPKPKEKSARAALHDLLKGFDGIQKENYVFSASEQEKSFLQQRPFQNFRFDSSATDKESVRNQEIRNADDGNYEELPWYLIETRSNIKQDSFNEFTPIQRYASRSSDVFEGEVEPAASEISEPKSITANTLSELLQIFKYTPAKPEVFKPAPVKAFRYTRPTETSVVATTESVLNKNSRLANREKKHFEVDSIKELSLVKVQPLATTTTAKSTVKRDSSVEEQVAEKVILDGVAETNSLDGYLFSDSEVLHDYISLGKHPNAIQLINSVDKPTAKNSSVIDKIKLTSLYQRDRVIGKNKVNNKPTTPTISTTTTTTSTSTTAPVPYIIIQGHSKVKVYGASNKNAKENIFEKLDKLFTQSPQGKDTYTTSRTFTEGEIVTITEQPTENTIEPEVTTSPTFYAHYPEDYGYDYYGSDFLPLTDQPQYSTPQSFSEGILPWIKRNLKLPNPPPPTIAEPEKELNNSTEFSALLPNLDSSLVRNFFSISRPVFFTKRKHDEIKPENKEEKVESSLETVLSNPFEYVSHLKMLSRPTDTKH